MTSQQAPCRIQKFFHCSKTSIRRATNYFSLSPCMYIDMYIYIHGQWISLVHLVDSHGRDCWRDSSTLSPDFLTPVTRRDSTKFQDPVISKFYIPRKKMPWMLLTTTFKRNQLESKNNASRLQNIYSAYSLNAINMGRFWVGVQGVKM